ncbi:hypothetical protein AKJ37_05755 [candidate division MSBL1 archaeon SCGC-AAA259I09]|uniref:Protein AKJ37_05755 n=1 Tax=candidate division MSBL1 archaeon SCGC-AAA259I09 TaxID=1698267 RepID=A0A133UPX7_9EURY|nr:hypothetical protein AKJ37_05755 [candidate division MSBL1 archaeon SCGC-AAA259I09]
MLLSLNEGKEIVELARKIIESHLKEEEMPEISEGVKGTMEEKKGVFVTLNKGKELRGCIGRPMPNQKLKEGLEDAAIDAATGDPRFSPLGLEELGEVTVEVSVLTTPGKIEVEDPKKYREEVEIGRDGLIVSYRGRNGLLLPQVPLDRGWDAEEFLSQTCMKAGATPDCWLDRDVEIQKFSAQVFKEEGPGGEVVEESLSS